MSDTSQTDTTNTPPAAATDAGPAPVLTLEEQLAAARADASANHERYLRTVADMENFRKRTLREKDELRQYAAANVVEDIIPIMDNLSLGLAAAAQQGNDGKSIVEGVTMVLEQFKSTLARHGLKEVNPVGQAFDPNQHDCISHQPDANVAAEQVTQVVRMGYTLNGRLLRPASVVVSSGPAKSEAKA